MHTLRGPKPVSFNPLARRGISVKIPDQKHHLIASKLERYLKEPTNAELARVAREQRAVPIYAGWTGTTFLRTDGEFFTLDQEDHPGEFFPETNEYWQIATLATAGRRDPDFASLLPERKTAASDCSACSGKGFVMLGEKPLDVTCGECAGLGWIDPSLKQRAR